MFRLFFLLLINGIMVLGYGQTLQAEMFIIQLNRVTGMWADRK
jgi:hypothetical protein